MKKQNKDSKELEKLNFELGEVLSQVPAGTRQEKEYQGVEEETEKEKKRISPKKIAVVLCAILLIICVGGVIAFAGMWMKGKQDLLTADNMDITAPELEGEEINVENNGDLVVYNGEKYCYNHDIVTVLMMGVDQTQDERLENQQDGLMIGNGQADTVILAAMDVETGKTTLINVSRDSMVDVDMYTVSGNFAGDQKMQLCLAYAYGVGEDGGCLNVSKSVSRLLYGIPVSSYAAIGLSAINVLNDAIGGVEVEVLETLGNPGSEMYMEAGTKVTLKGAQAEMYVRSRDAYFGGAESNSKRMERQKQYLTSFASRALQETKKDITVPLTLFDVASEYMVTDLNAAKVSYLVSILSKVGLEESSFLTVPGEAVLNEQTGYAEFMVDDKALYEMILDVFYKKMDHES